MYCTQVNVAQALTCVGVLSRLQRIRPGQGLLRLKNNLFSLILYVCYQELNHDCFFYTKNTEQCHVCVEVKFHWFSWNALFISNWQAIRSCVLLVPPIERLWSKRQAFARSSYPGYLQIVTHLLAAGGEGQEGGRGEGQEGGWCLWMCHGQTLWFFCYNLLSFCLVAILNLIHFHHNPYIFMNHFL